MSAAVPTRAFVYGKDDPRRQVIHALEGQPHDGPKSAVVLLHGGGLTAGSPLQDGRLADVAPTVLAALGVQPPAAMDGASLAPHYDWGGPRRVLPK